VPDRPLYPPRREHLELMTGPFGIWQHARGRRPDRSFGTSIDDVARSLTVDLLQSRVLGWETVGTTARRSLALITNALNPSTGQFRNFRSADGDWLDVQGSQDTQGRALLATGLATRDAPNPALRHEALSLWRASLPVAADLTSPRAIASTILGSDAAISGGLFGETERVFAMMVSRLRGAFSGIDLDGDWPWPEETLTYENALLPHALIVAGVRLGDGRLRSIGLTVLDWLISVQTSRRATFTPIGNDGWWPHGGERSHFDQQPIEAAAIIFAAQAAYEATQDRGYIRSAESAYAWFLGDNDAGLALADVATGGCCDGLSADHVNENQGAESTLMWLTALETMRQLRTRAMATQGQRGLAAKPVLVALRT
jgi:hypothetical protein